MIKIRKTGRTPAAGHRPRKPGRLIAVTGAALAAAMTVAVAAQAAPASASSASPQGTRVTAPTKITGFDAAVADGVQPLDGSLPSAHGPA